MTLGALKKHIKELEERGATDDSEVMILDAEYGDYYHIQFLELEFENVVIIPE